MFNLLFLLSVGNSKSAIDTLPSFAIFPPRNLKFRLTAQASFHLVECVMLFQRIDLMFFRVEWWGGILKGGEETHLLPSLLPCRVARRGCCRDSSPFEFSSLHFCQLIIKFEFPKVLSVLQNLPSVGNNKSATGTLCRRIL